MTEILSDYQDKSVLGEVFWHFLKNPDTLLARGGKPFAASIDVTPNCNLRCPKCYIYEKPYQEEGTNDQEFLERVRWFREEYPGIVHCTWVGGEPMERRRVLREAVKYFPANWIVTNGTIPIEGEWVRTGFFVSIDGTKEIHDRLRPYWKPGSRQSVYERAKENANKATAPVSVHTTIEKTNIGSIPDLVREWKRETKIKGFVFSFQTPISDPTRSSGIVENYETMMLDSQSRKDAVLMILELKRIYGDYILMSEGQIKNLLPERQVQIFGPNCMLPKSVVSLDARFNRKLPCVMGPGMNCDQCGCTIPAMVDRAKRLDIKTFGLVLKATVQ